MSSHPFISTILVLWAMQQVDHLTDSIRIWAAKEK